MKNKLFEILRLSKELFWPPSLTQIIAYVLFISWIVIEIISAQEVIIPSWLSSINPELFSTGFAILVIDTSIQYKELKEIAKLKEKANRMIQKFCVEFLELRNIFFSSPHITQLYANVLINILTYYSNVDVEVKNNDQLWKYLKNNPIYSQLFERLTAQQYLKITSFSLIEQFLDIKNNEVDEIYEVIDKFQGKLRPFIDSSNRIIDFYSKNLNKDQEFALWEINDNLIIFEQYFNLYSPKLRPLSYYNNKTEFFDKLKRIFKTQEFRNTIKAFNSQLATLIISINQTPYEFVKSHDPMWAHWTSRYAQNSLMFLISDIGAVNDQMEELNQAIRDDSESEN